MPLVKNMVRWMKFEYGEGEDPGGGSVNVWLRLKVSDEIRRADATAQVL